MAVAFEASDKTRLIEDLALKLKARYVFPEIGSRAGMAILSAAGSGNYDSFSGADLAAALTADLQAETRDLHLRVYFHPDCIPAPNGEGGGSGRVLPVNDPGAKRVEVLQGNVGYLELARFPAEEAFAPEADEAMRALADTVALIIDLRSCKGGSPDAVAYLCSFFFDPAWPTHLNTLHWRGQPSVEFWTKPVGFHYQAPLIVLTSRSTFSGAEEFANNMKVLRRATLIGEITRGGAHPGTRFPVGTHFEVFIPMGRAENPITKSNWEGTGVAPDVVVPADDAIRHALDRVLQK